eukprot:752989-Hanusia_phi.AAC.3
MPLIPGVPCAPHVPLTRAYLLFPGISVGHGAHGTKNMATEREGERRILTTEGKDDEPLNFNEDNSNET